MSGSIRIAATERSVEALLVRYAAGSLSAPLHRLIAAHLEMRPDNRAYVAALETAGGALLESIEPLPLPERDRRIADIVAHRPETVGGKQAVPSPANPVLPPTLRVFYGRDFVARRWRTLLPGLRQCVLSKEDGVEVSFLRGRAGTRLFAHTHDGFEVALVLAGGYSDETGHYLPGDIALADQSVNHRPVVDRDGECLIFLVLEGSVRLTGPFGRIWQRIVG